MFCPLVSVTPPLFASHLLEIYRYFLKLIILLTLYLLLVFACYITFIAFLFLMLRDVEETIWAKEMSMSIDPLPSTVRPCLQEQNFLI